MEIRMAKAEKVTISLPPELLREFDEALREEGRARSPTLQKFIRDWLKQRRREMATNGQAELVNNAD